MKEKMDVSRVGFDFLAMPAFVESRVTSHLAHDLAVVKKPASVLFIRLAR